MTFVEELQNLSERLMGVPVMYGVDQGDVETISKAADEIMRLTQQIAALESLRPHWAQGYTSDSVAAQANVAALAQLWGLLAVTDQTQAVLRLRSLR